MPLIDRSPALRLAAACSLALAVGVIPSGSVQAQDSSLPDIGSSAAAMISPAQEAIYGRQLLGELRRLDLVVEDPILQEWLSGLGQRLAVHSERPEQPFTFFLLRERAINAFATLGGYIGTNAGLALTAEREDEVAAVLAHEISHATQRHIVRSAEAAQKDSLPIMLAMLGAVLVAQSAGDSSGDASQAAIAGGMALLQQRRINFTRANEHEADRIGIQMLARAGFEPIAMADFFGRMHRATRSQGDAIPDYLRTHPVTTTRISEAKDRAARTPTPPAISPPVSGGLNPAIPAFAQAGLAATGQGADPRRFAFARERMRVFSAAHPRDVAHDYRRRIAAGETLSDAQRYGLAVANLLSDQAEAASRALQDLQQQHPDLYWIELALAEAQMRSGEHAAAELRFAALLDRHPGNRAVVLAYAGLLAERGDAEAGKRAQGLLRPLLADGLEDPLLQRSFARACEQAGDLNRAAEAHAEAAFLSGRAEDALNQLQRLKDQANLDYVQRARVDARIAVMTPVVLELRAQGVRPGDARRGGAWSLQPR